MKLVQLGPADVETLREALWAEAATDDDRNARLGVLLAVDSDGLKVREAGRWTAPIGKVSDR